MFQSGISILDCAHSSTGPSLLNITQAPEFVYAADPAVDNCVYVGPSKGVCMSVSFPIFVVFLSFFSTPPPLEIYADVFVVLLV